MPIKQGGKMQSNTLCDAPFDLLKIEPPRLRIQTVDNVNNMLGTAATWAVHSTREMQRKLFNKCKARPVSTRNARKRSRLQRLQRSNMHSMTFNGHAMQSKIKNTTNCKREMCSNEVWGKGSSRVENIPLIHTERCRRPTLCCSCWLP